MDKKELLKEAEIMFEKINKQQAISSQDFTQLYFKILGKTIVWRNCSPCIKEWILEMRQGYNIIKEQPCSDCNKEEVITTIEEVEECCSEHIEVPDEIIPKTKKINKKKNGK